MQPSVGSLLFRGLLPTSVGSGVFVTSDTEDIPIDAEGRLFPVQPAVFTALAARKSHAR